MTATAMTESGATCETADRRDTSPYRPGHRAPVTARRAVIALVWLAGVAAGVAGYVLAVMSGPRF